MTSLQMHYREAIIKAMTDKSVTYGHRGVVSRFFKPFEGVYSFQLEGNGDKWFYIFQEGTQGRFYKMVNLIHKSAKKQIQLQLTGLKCEEEKRESRYLIHYISMVDGVPLG